MKKPIPFGKYYLLERINVGGMAEVFRAKAYGVEGFERLLAVKRILPNIAEDQEFITMFIDEAKIAVQLNHANIAQIFDLGVVDGSYFIAMEHIHGRDLRAIFERCRGKGEPMPIAQACFAGMKICEGLDYAHNKRDAQAREMHLVHRDVSPQNVIVSFEGEIKLIDFGIAKAAGKMGKTQAGILKGKFGYMSPEQVRGLPIDRRSDIFSTGIVLYELLTNERLFHGESDFSTLEKVRNVEILPPSTYNRKIPEELERIVLKALAKDVDDRYQNAIDLHDELQAFVYTAGEFYSRKDLASWMKKTFTKEIEEETAKLESYRQMAPPEVVRAPSGQRPAATSTPPPQGVRRPTIGMAAVPPPAPNGRAPRASSGPPPPPGAAPAAAGKDAGPAKKKARPAGAHGKDDQTNELEWDDEELETQIYDNPPEHEGEPAVGAEAPTLSGGEVEPVGAAPAGGGLAASLGAAPVTPIEAGEAREKSGPARAGRRTLGGAAVSAAPVAEPPAAGTPPQQLGMQTLQGFGSPATAPKLPPPLNGSAQGSGQGAAPSDLPFAATAAAGDAVSKAFPPAPATEEPSAIVNIARMGAAGMNMGIADPMAAPLPAIPAQPTQRPSKAPLIAAIAGVAVLAAGVGLYFAFSGSGDGKTETAAAEPPDPPADKPADPAAGGAIPPADKPADPPSGPTAPAGPADPNSGFEVWTEPAKAQVKLDGVPVKGETPFAMTNLTLGKHVVEVSLPGFLPQTKDAVVEAGKVTKLEFKLVPAQVATRFTSEPPGAKVTIVSDAGREVVGARGEIKLDASKKYEVVFEKDGYVTVTRTVDPAAELAASGLDTLTVAVVLERAQLAVAAPKDPPKDPPAVRDPPKDPPKDPAVVRDPPKDPPPRDPPKDPPPRDPPPRDPPKDPPAVAGTGTLMIGAKPQCKIYIDGKDTGLSTPQRSMEVKAGTRKITLVNNEFGIRETFSVDVKPNETTKAIKDYSDKIPQ